VLAVRRTFNGTYFKGWITDMFSEINLKIPYVELHDIELGDDNIAGIRENTTGIEGYVVKWDDGTYVKIKTDEYTEMHRAVSYFNRENMILPVVLDRQCDDLYPALSVERADKLREYEVSVMEEFME